MGYRVDNLTAADRRINERLTIIAARGGDVAAFRTRFLASDREALSRMVEVIERYGAAIEAEENA